MKISQDVIDICQILQDKKAEDIVICNTIKPSNIANNVIIVTASSIAHAKSLASLLEEFLINKPYKVINREGFNYCDWIALDMDEIVVHIFTKQKREYYNLEKLLNDGNNIKSFDKVKKIKIKQEKEDLDKKKQAEIKAKKLQKKVENKEIKNKQVKEKKEAKENAKTSKKEKTKNKLKLK